MFIQVYTFILFLIIIHLTLLIRTTRLLGMGEYEKNQEASYNSKLDFALSNRPHFNSVYLVRVPFLTGIAVLKNRLVLSQKSSSMVPTLTLALFSMPKQFGTTRFTFCIAYKSVVKTLAR